MKMAIFAILLLAGMLLLYGCTQQPPAPSPGGTDMPPAPPDGSTIGVGGVNATNGGPGGEAPPPPPG